MADRIPRARFPPGRLHRGCHKPIRGLGRHQERERGLVSRCEFVKLHVIVDAKGRKIVFCAVIKGCAHDSPIFREMFENVPDGLGCVMLDAGYDAVKNYKMIQDSGRRPVICTLKNHVVRGFGPEAR